MSSGTLRVDTKRKLAHIFPRFFRYFFRRIFLVVSKICRRKRGSGGNRAWLAIVCSNDL